MKILNRKLKNYGMKWSIKFTDLIDNPQIFINQLKNDLQSGYSYNILYTTIFDNGINDYKKSDEIPMSNNLNSQILFKNSYISFFLFNHKFFKLDKSEFKDLVSLYHKWGLRDPDFIYLQDLELKGIYIDYKFYIPFYSQKFTDLLLMRVRNNILARIQYLLDTYKFELGNPLDILFYIYKPNELSLKEYRSSSMVEVLGNSVINKNTNWKLIPLAWDLWYYGKLLDNSQKNLIFFNIISNHKNINKNIGNNIINYDIDQENILDKLNNIPSNKNINIEDNIYHELKDKINKTIIFNLDFLIKYYHLLKVFDYKLEQSRFIIVLDLNKSHYIWVFNEYFLEYFCIDDFLDTHHFIRNIDNHKLVIYDNELKSWFSKFTLDSINIPENSGVVKKNSKFNLKIGTLDLECFTNYDKSDPFYENNYVYSMGYAVFKENRSSSFENLKFKIYYLEDFKSNNYPSISMVIEGLKSMLINYPHYVFYAHNLGGYDGIYLLNILSKYNEICDPSERINFDLIFRDSNILKINLQIKIKGKKYSIAICDSYALLNISLRKLCQVFNIPSQYQKSSFPYEFINIHNLNYIGPAPNLNENPNINNDDDRDLKINIWNLRNEVEKYLIKDLGSLLLILEKFRVFIAQEFSMDIRKNLTISRLGFNIFNHQYQGFKNIPQITNNRLYSFIRDGLYGGVNSVYIPYGENLYYYDVNSLYPAMAYNNDFGGNLIEFIYHYQSFFENYKSNINNFKDKTLEDLDLDNLFGFFKAEVITPHHLKFGLLPVRDYKRGLIFPLGKFSGTWFSEELKFAKKHGYLINIKEGYTFNKISSPFKSYVKDLYNLKVNNVGGRNFVYKSLLNNLIGRFGIDIQKAITKVVNKKQFDFLISTCQIVSIMEIFNDNLFIVKFIPKPVPEICAINNLDFGKVIREFKNYHRDYYKDASVMITAMVNSYARIWLNNFKLELINKGYNIYYCDTDSLVIDKPLFNCQNNNMGEFRLIAKIKKGYFISNKLYFMIDENNNIITANKGVNFKLSEKDFINLLNNKSVETLNKVTVKNIYNGDVRILYKNIKLNFNGFNKRIKIYDDKGNWINTKPIIY